MKILTVSFIVAVVVAAIDYLVDPFAVKPAVLAALATLILTVVLTIVPGEQRVFGRVFPMPTWAVFTVGATFLLWVAAIGAAIRWGVS